MRLKNTLTQSRFGVALRSTEARVLSIKYNSPPHTADTEWQVRCPGRTSSLQRNQSAPEVCHIQDSGTQTIPQPDTWDERFVDREEGHWTTSWRESNPGALVVEIALSVFQELDRSFEVAKRPRPSSASWIVQYAECEAASWVTDRLLSRVFISATRRQENQAIQKPPMSKQIRKSTSGWASS